MRYFFCGSFVFLCLVFLMLLLLFIAALWSPAGKGLTSWLLLMMFIVFLLLSHVVSWVRCGTWLYYFLIFASVLTMSNCEVVTFPLVSWVRCDAWLYRFLIFALFLTLLVAHTTLLEISCQGSYTLIKQLQYCKKEAKLSRPIFQFFVKMSSLLRLLHIFKLTTMGNTTKPEQTAGQFNLGPQCLQYRLHENIRGRKSTRQLSWLVQNLSRLSKHLLPVWLCYRK